MSDIVPVNRGSDLLIPYEWPDGAGGAANLTGYSVTIYAASAGIEPHLTVVMADAAAGRIDVTLTWDEAIPVGNVSQFQLRITAPSGFRTTCSAIKVKII
jgi:hypothetical protein